MFYGLRMIWYCRNELAHGKECMEVTLAAILTKNRVLTFLKPSFKFRTIDESGGMIWETPERPFLKINSYGSWFPSSKRLRYAFVVSGWDGSVVAVKDGFRQDGCSAFEAEGVSLSNAMQWAAESGWLSCIFEIDCCQLFSVL